MNASFAATTVPTDLAVHLEFEQVDYADCYAASIPADRPAPGVDRLARGFFSDGMPRWIRRIVEMQEGTARKAGRDSGWTLVDPAEPSRVVPGQRVGPWLAVARTETEIVFREDSPHLDFAFSLNIREAEDSRRIEATTLVRFHNAAGRIYFAPVRPFHRRLVPAHMDSVLRAAA